MATKTRVLLDEVRATLDENVEKATLYCRYVAAWAMLGDLVDAGWPGEDLLVAAYALARSRVNGVTPDVVKVAVRKFKALANRLAPPYGVESTAEDRAFQSRHWAAVHKVWGELPRRVINAPVVP